MSLIFTRNSTNLYNFDKFVEIADFALVRGGELKAALARVRRFHGGGEEGGARRPMCVVTSETEEYRLMAHAMGEEDARFAAPRLPP